MTRHTTASTLTRRSFLGSTAIGLLAGPVVLRGSLGFNTLNVALVGVGGRGWSNLQGVKDAGVNVVGLCDVDANVLARAAAAFPDASTHRDYREMIDGLEDRVDAVVVSTPDHTHAPASIMAMRRGKHVYCEKPLAHTVEECRVMARLAKARRLATQMGTQIHAGDNYRRVVELVKSGAIGPVRRAHVWCGKSWSNGRFSATKEPPAHLDWDLWLGPAPVRDYCDGIHPANWRRFWTYGTGTLGDMACHYIDLVFWALDLGRPVAIKTTGPEVHPVGTPDSLQIDYEFPSRGDQPPVHVTWYDGNRRPKILADLKRADGSPLNWGDGQLFIGEDGMILSNYSSHVLLPEDKFANFQRPDRFIPSSIGHYREWTKACASGEPTTCAFEYGGNMTEAVLLGNVAFRLQQELRWDGQSMEVTNAEDVAMARSLIRKSYREGFGIS